MSDARRWEVAIDIAARIERAADDGAPDERRSEIGEALEKLIARFDCFRADDLSARAMVALAEAWLATLEADELDQFWAEDEAGGANADPVTIRDEDRYA